MSVAVSYTHLDVYKRQMLLYIFVKFNYRIESLSFVVQGPGSQKMCIRDRHSVMMNDKQEVGSTLISITGKYDS